MKDGQISLSDYLRSEGFTSEDTDLVDPPEMSIDKPIRLIELFSGVGSQAMALRDLGADFEHYRAVEIDAFAMRSYNAIHGTSFEPADIRSLHGSDLGITDKDRYTYILTWSFPCTSISIAGKREGMTEGSNTQSSLLWEVMRLLGECEEKPDVLLMENVTEVHRNMNEPEFKRAIMTLEGMGYRNSWRDLNARYYGVAQNRDRTFMVSLLEKRSYEFPEETALMRCMKDYLDDHVDEAYYLKNERAARLIERMELEDEHGDYGGESEPGECAPDVGPGDGPAGDKPRDQGRRRLREGGRG